MFGRFFKKGDNVTRADLGQESSMYFDPVKKRWREKGKEHLEEEEKELAPPPKPSEMSEEKKEEKKEAPPATGVDALCGTPNMHRNLIRKPPQSTPSSSAAADGDGPPPGPSMPPMGGPFGTAAPQANPFAPKGFGGTVSQPSNPNAPRGFGGAATLPTNPNAPRGRDPKEKRERPKQKPVPARSAAFGGMPAHSPLPGVAPPAPGGGLPGVLPPGVMPKPPEPAATDADEEEKDGEKEVEQEHLVRSPEAPQESPEAAQDGFPIVAEVDPEGPNGDFDPEGAAKEDEVPEIVPNSVKEELDPEGSVTDEIDPEGFVSKPVEESADFVSATQLAESEEVEDGELCEEPVIEPAEIVDEAKVLPPVEELSSADFDDAFADMDTSPEKNAAAENIIAPDTTSVVENVEEIAAEETPEGNEGTTALDSKEIPAPADNHGWDDFEMDDDVTNEPPPPAATKEEVTEEPVKEEPEETETEKPKAVAVEADDSGWGDFDDDNWGDDAPDTSAVAAPDQAPTEEISKDLGDAIEEVEPVDASVDKGIVADAPEIGTANKDPETSWSGNGESISSWVDLGDGALTPPVVATETEDPPANPPSEEVPCVPDAADEDQKDAALELASAETAVKAEAQTSLEEKPDDSALRQELDESNAENLKLKVRLAELEELMSSLDAKVDRLEADKIELTSENSRMRSEAETFQATEDNLSRELSSRAQALKFRDDEIQSLTLKLQESEARAAESSDTTGVADNNSRVEELEQSLKEAQRQTAEMEVKLAAALAASTASPGELDVDLRSPDRTSDEFNLPDFVWNCGNSQVMEYVQKLVNDNAVLKRQASSSMSIADESQVSKEVPCTPESFDAKETDPEVGLDGIATSLGRPHGHAVDGHYADAAKQRLQQAGIDCTSPSPRFTDDARSVYIGSPFAKETSDTDVFMYRTDESATMPSMEQGHGDLGIQGAALDMQLDMQALGRRRMYGHILRGLDALQAARLHSRMPVARQEVLLAAGGIGVGSFWTMVPTENAQRCSNAQWSIAFRQRLGMQSNLGTDARCQLSKRDGEVCGAVLDTALRHPTLCGKGPAQLRRHTAIMTVLARDLERAGAAVDIERVVPEWYTITDSGIEEARLDLVVRFPGAPFAERIESSIRSPFSVSFDRANGGRATALQIGVACKQGEEEKHHRYGEGFALLVFETLGRLGYEGLALLRRLQRQAMDYGRRKPCGGRPVGLNLRRLRARLEAALLREVADATLLSMGCRSSLALGWSSSIHAATADDARQLRDAG